MILQNCHKWQLFKERESFIEEKRILKEILNSFTITFGKIIKCIDYAILTLRVECGNKRLKKLLNYSTELGMITKLKNNKLVSDAAIKGLKGDEALGDRIIRNTYKTLLREAKKDALYIVRMMC